MNSKLDSYKLRVGNLGLRQDLVKFWIETLLITLSPITPHFCDVMWNDCFLPCLGKEKEQYAELASLANFPCVKKE